MSTESPPPIDLTPDWRAVVAAWPGSLRQRHSALAATLHAKGWRPDSAAFLAYERITDEGEHGERSDR